MKTSRLTVYGLNISYFTGKLEAYLRYKEIPYTFQNMSAEYFNRIVPEKTGSQQMSAVQFADGSWATDTTPLIDWFEEQHGNASVLPEDPEQAYVCRLIEDYADEWLWRPAMHYRWSHFPDRQLLGTQIVDEMLTDVSAPKWLKRWQIRRRQKTHFVDRDGVNARTREHVEQGYLRVLDILQDIFSARPYILGDRPTLAANAIAWGESKTKYDVNIQGTHYQDLPVSRYRCWCLEQLQAQFKALPPATRGELQGLLEDQHCWQPLWQVAQPRSNYDPDGQAPFAVGLKVYPVQGA